jgi:tetratricopeptide (TPR) repeat protein
VSPLCPLWLNLLAMKSKLLLCTACLVTAALILIAAAPEKKPDPAEAARLNNLGCAYMNQQLFEKALKYFEDAAAADPNLQVAKVNQGIALLSLARVDAAKKVLEQAAKENPKDPHVWYALGMLEKNSSDPQAAVDDFHRVIEIDDSDPDTWYFLGTVYSQLKQFPQAIDAFDHALKLNPLHASAQFGLSRAYQQSGDTPHAREHLTRFQYVTQNHLGAAMSLAYGEQGKYSLCEESTTAAVKVPPQIPVKFVDVTEQSGLVTKPASSSGFDFTYLGPGACFLDYDNDGKIDLFLPGSGAQGGISLYQNLGNGKFEDVTRQAGFDPTVHAVSCTAGDYDNDGFVDLAVATKDRVLLFHNEKNGIFKDVTNQAGLLPKNSNSAAKMDISVPGTALGKSQGMPVSVTFIDYDHDGDLDLYVVKAAPAKSQTTSGVWTEEVPATLGDNQMWRNNGNGTFTDVTGDRAMPGSRMSVAAVGTDYNNDRAVDMVLTGAAKGATVFENPREGAFKVPDVFPNQDMQPTRGVAVLDFDHDGWMDFAFTHEGIPSITLWRNNHGKNFEPVNLPVPKWFRAFGIAAVDYDNDGWVDLVAVGETPGDGRGEVRLFRNLGPDGFEDVTADVGLDKIHLQDPRAVIAGDFDGDGATDLLITQSRGPAVLLKNEGGNKNNWLRLALKGLNDNKSAIGTKVEVFSDGIRQKFEIYGSNGYLGQNSPYLTVGIGQAKQADVVRMLWPTGVLQDEVEVAANQQKDFLEIDRRGSSCPTLFVWDGKRYELVSDILGAGVVGHWVAPGERNISRPTEWIKIDKNMVRALQTGPAGVDARGYTNHVGAGALTRPAEPSSAKRVLSFRLVEPMEEVVYLDAVKLLAVDHPANEEVYPNEYFASNPPYPDFKVITSSNARPPVGAWDDKGNNLLPGLLAHKYVGNFELLPFKGFTKPHSLILDLGAPYRGGPLRLLMHGEIEYFTATGMYAASQAGIEATAPYVEAEVPANDMAGEGARPTRNLSDKNVRPTRESSATGMSAVTTACSEYREVGSADSPVAQRRNLDSPARECREADGGAGSPDRDGTTSDRNVRPTQAAKWVRVTDDMGFPAGLPKTIAADLSGKLPEGTTRIRITTNLQIYWDSILIDRSNQNENFKLTSIPLTKATLDYHGYPRQIEDQPPGNVKYVYEQVSRTGPYARQAGEYTRYGDVTPLLTSFDDKLAVFGSGEEVQLEFNPRKLPPLPKGWTRDYFFMANGYEKDMDFYAADGSTVAPLPFRRMGTYPYPGKSFPVDDEHLKYMLEFNTRFVSGNEPRGYSYDFARGK